MFRILPPRAWAGIRLLLLFAMPAGACVYQTQLILDMLAGGVIFALLLALWLGDGLILRRLLRRDLMGALTFSAATSLPLVLLPLISQVDMAGLAFQLRLGLTPPQALAPALVVLLLLTIRSSALLLRSPELRAATVTADRSAERISLAALGLQAVLMAGWVWRDQGIDLINDTAGLGPGWSGPAGAGAVLVLATAVHGLPLLALRWLGRGRVGGLLRLEAVSWAPSLVAALLMTGALAAGWLSSWDVTLHLLLGLVGALLFKLFYLQVNAASLRLVNAASLVLVLLIILGLEGAARLTYLDIAWAGTPGGRFTASDVTGWLLVRKEFEYLEKVQVWKKYPDSMFPAKFTSRGTGRATRVVFLGGSSTGGANQMDNLDDFFPAHLQRKLDRVAGEGKFQVINQGVGGWNTHHIRLYLRQYIAALDPDLLVLYVGNNDFESSMGDTTYREMWQRYKAQGRRLNSVLGFLRRSRLFVGFQCLVGARHGLKRETNERVAAVPPEHARENLTEVFKLAKAQGARVILLSEALWQPSRTYQPYRDMLREVARSQGGVFVDTHLAMTSGSHSEYFLDNCHLSSAGHARLAELLQDVISAP